MVDASSMPDDAHDAVATVAALHAARRTGVLDALLESAATPAEAAAETGVDERAASVLVDVLADRGFFEHVDGVYEPTNRALGLLTKTDLRSIGRLPHEIDRFEAYAGLPDALASEADAERAESSESTPTLRAAGVEPGDAGRNRLGYVQATPNRVVNAAVSAAARATPDATAILDLGGAPGPYASEFAARGYDVTLRDTPAAIDASRPLLEPRDVVLDPGELDPGPLAPDASDAGDDIQEGAEAGLPAADLVFANDLAPRLDRPALERAFAACHDALDRSDLANASTALVCVEHVRGRSPGAPTRRLDALATGDPGDCRTEAELADALQTAGFEAISVREIPGVERHAVVATPRRT